ncbi:MAG: conjugal transfer protein [Acidimicrobiales bacterium]
MRRRRDDVDEAPVTASERPGVPPALQLLGVRAASVGLWGLVVLGALAGLASFFVRQAPAGASAPRMAERPPSIGAEGFAELYVATYLSEAGAGDATGAAKAFYPVQVDLREMQARALYVAQTVALAASELGEGYWSVTVGARVLAAAGGGYQPLGTRAYQVGVARSATGYVATSLPAQVPMPAPAAVPKLAGQGLNSPAQDEPTVAATRFFAAFLAGDGELARYVSPDSEMRAITPPPYATIALRRVGIEDHDGADGARLVRAEVAATDAAGRTQILGYSLELARREGRWEVRRLLSAPPLASPAEPGEFPAEPATREGGRSTTTATAAPATTTPTTAVASGASTTTTRRP